MISIPLSFFAGIGGASNQGVLVKGSNYLETLAQTSYVVFDKTGTMTQGVFEVSGVHHNEISDEKLLEYAALAECSSSHPISKSLQKAYGKPIDRNRVTDIEEISGNGVTAKVDGISVAAGNAKLMKRLGISYQECHHVGTVIHMAVDGKYEGHILISDILKPHAKEAIAELKPSYMSVTYGAGGGTSKNTVKIASHIKDKYNVPSLAHLTCVSSTKEEVHQVIDQLKASGIENILALRGDIPQESEFPLPNHYQYAYELIEDIKSQGDFCIGAACYPEGHVESEHKKDDIAHLKQKVDCGVDFLTTQMFFDNSIFYNYMYRLREAGVLVPVIAGIMPITRKNQVGRSIQLSGSCVPARFKSIVDWFGDDPAKMKQAGIAYATDQIIDLIANGISHIHVYTMNDPEVAAGIMNNLSAILH